MVVIMKMSPLNVLAFLSLFFLVLVQDIIAQPPPIYDPSYPVPGRPYGRANYRRPWRRAELEEKPTLPPDLLDVPLKVETNATTPKPSSNDGSTKTTTTGPNELPLDDPVEPNDSLMSTTTTTSTKKPSDPPSRLFPEDTTARDFDRADVELSHPDSPAESSGSGSYNYPVFRGGSQARYNLNSGGYYSDPVLSAKLRQARRRLIESSNDRSDLASSRIVDPDPDFADDDD